MPARGTPTFLRAAQSRHFFAFGERPGSIGFPHSRQTRTATTTLSFAGPRELSVRAQEEECRDGERKPPPAND